MKTKVTCEFSQDEFLVLFKAIESLLHGGHVDLTGLEISEMDEMVGVYTRVLNPAAKELLSADTGERQ